MISVIIPFYNEKDSLETLYKGISEALKGKEYETIFIDDGSTDGSTLSFERKHAKLLTHKTRKGKGAALRWGIREASGDIIVFMDADLQDDPADINKFLEKIDEGYDLVNGWRKTRHDGLIKTLPSKIGNLIILKTILQSRFHDINCGYKAMKKTVLEEIVLYGDHFRFVPLIAERSGFKTTEVVVEHHSRKYGQSKFGFFRRFTIFADILTAYFIYRFAEKPLHFFGSIGGSFFGLGFIIALYLSYERIVHGILLYRRPALLLAVLLIIVGAQIIMTGIVAELLVYLHNKSKMKD